MRRSSFLASLPTSSEEIADLRSIEEEVYAAAEHAASALRGSKAVANVRLESAVAHLASELIRLDAMPASKPITCKKGCGECCIAFRILIGELEVINLVRAIEQSPKRAFILSQIRVSEPTSDGAGSAKKKCAMLSLGRECMVHAARPITCHGYASKDRVQCRKYASGKGPLPSTVPVYRYLAVNALYDVLMPAVVVGTSAPNAVYEINSILHRIYSRKRLLELWRAGLPTYEQDLDIAIGAS